MARVLIAVRRLVHQDDGQDLIEYGLLAVLIAVVVVAAAASLGNAVNTVFWVRIAQNF